MKIFLSFVCIMFFIAVGLGPTPAQADVLVASGKPNLCLDWNTSTNNVALWDCHGGYNQNFFTASYGQQHYGNFCLDHGPLTDPGNLRGGYLIMAPCANKPSQRWVLTDSGDRSPNRLRNEEGSCVNIPGGLGYANRGQALIVWTCQSGYGSSINDVWSRGRFTALNATGAPQSVLTRMGGPGTIYVISPSSIISHDGGTVVAAGGGNVVSQGGGNVVSQGGGNAVILNGGAVVSQGGGNLITSDGAGLVNTNGGNLVGSGGASAIGNNGSSILTNNGGTMRNN